jgi:hypothetical protein
MALLSVAFRLLLLLAPLTNFAGHVRCADDMLKSTAEFNRCLTAVRVALTRRGVLDIESTGSAARAGLRTRPSRQV